MCLFRGCLGVCERCKALGFGKCEECGGPTWDHVPGRDSGQHRFFIEGRELCSYCVPEGTEGAD